MSVTPFAHVNSHMTFEFVYVKNGQFYINATSRLGFQISRVATPISALHHTLPRTCRCAQYAFYRISLPLFAHFFTFKTGRDICLYFYLHTHRNSFRFLSKIKFNNKHFSSKLSPSPKNYLFAIVNFDRYKIAQALLGRSCILCFKTVI